MARVFLDACVDEIARSAAARPGKTPPNLHGQWLVSLQSGDGLFRGRSRDLADFARQVESWQRPVAETVGAPFRLCIRLQEPEETGLADAVDDDRWAFTYFLQDVTDRSRLIPAEEIWNGTAHAWLGEQHPEAKTLLTALLGQAARLSPVIAASLQANTLSGGWLSTEAAWQFLDSTASLLRQNGFAVQLPSWWTQPDRPQPRLRVQVESSGTRHGQGMNTGEVMAARWEVALGDATLTPQELLLLAQQKAPLVRLRGRWVEFDSEAMRKWMERMRAGASRVTVGELLRMELGIGAPGESAIEVHASGWVGDLLRQVHGERRWEPLTPPRGLDATLRPYQSRGFSWLSFLQELGLGACLADDMGLGKTIQTLAYLQHRREQGNRLPALLICPMSVLGNWQREVQRFTPHLPVFAWHGARRPRGEKLWPAIQDCGLVMTTYGLMQRDIESLRTIEWSAVILDEAQNIKNAGSLQARAARRLAAAHRIALTGTPVENHVGELWSIMEFLNPGLLGSRETFARHWQIPIQSGDQQAAGQLRRLTGPFLLRRLKTDPAIVGDLPEKMEMKVFCPITREQAGLYAAVIMEMERDLDAATGMKRRGTILATLTRLKQICNHPAHFLQETAPLADRSGKLRRLEDMLEEVLDSGECALLFTQFTEMGRLLQRRLQERFGREVLFLHGGVVRAQRDRLIERFQSPDGPPLFVLSLKAGGTGLNLVRAQHVFHFDRWWNPAVENQATDRAFRIGQTRRVQVHKFICQGTVEERIDALIDRKRGIAESIVGTGEQWLTELSTRELKDLFALSREAVEET